MSPAVAEAAIAFAAKQDACKFQMGFLGGEPFLPRNRDRQFVMEISSGKI